MNNFGEIVSLFGVLFVLALTLPYLYVAWICLLMLVYPAGVFPIFIPSKNRKLYETCKSEYIRWDVHIDAPSSLASRTR